VYRNRREVDGHRAVVRACSRSDPAGTRADCRLRSKAELARDRENGRILPAGRASCRRGQTVPRAAGASFGRERSSRGRSRGRRQFSVSGMARATSATGCRGWMFATTRLIRRSRSRLAPETRNRSARRRAARRRRRRAVTISATTFHFGGRMQAGPRSRLLPNRNGGCATARVRSRSSRYGVHRGIIAAGGHHASHDENRFVGTLHRGGLEQPGDDHRSAAATGTGGRRIGPLERSTRA
jgi:hypothetical protein